MYGLVIIVDIVCLFGLMVVYMVCCSLYEGESDVVLVGGVVLMLELCKVVVGFVLGMLFLIGCCCVFDVVVDGFVLGEGCVVVVFKWLLDVLVDGDWILVVICGMFVN